MQNIHEKPAMKNCLSPNLGCIIDGIDGIDVCSSYMNPDDVTPPPKSIYIFVCIWGHNMT